MAKPGHLPLGVAAGGALRGRDRLAERLLAPQMRQELGHADRLHRRQVRRSARVRRALRLVERAGLDHPKKAARRRRRKAPRAAAISRIVAKRNPALPAVCRCHSPDRQPGGAHDLQGADQPLPCRPAGAGAPPPGRARPAARETRRRRARDEARSASCLISCRDFRYRREPARQRAQIEAGAADENRQAAGFDRAGDLAPAPARASAPPSRARRHRESRRAGAARAARRRVRAAPSGCGDRDRSAGCRH